MGNKTLAFLIVLLVQIYGVTASKGDQLDEFVVCKLGCVKKKCPDLVDPDIRKETDGLSSPLYDSIEAQDELIGQAINDYSLTWVRKTVFRWTCPHECDYQCQQIITEKRVEQFGKPGVVQFHGKWPFRRVLGIQEPASVGFSLLNMLAHIYGIRELNRISKLFTAVLGQHGDTEPQRLASWAKLIGYVGVNAWVWSAVFHSRDTLITERLDYFSAGGYIVCGLVYAIIRNMRLAAPQKYPKDLYVGLIGLFALSLHIGFLSLVRFDYSYNMFFNVSMGVAQNMAWLYYSFCFFHTPPPEINDVDLKPMSSWYQLKPALIVVWFLCAMALELYDFPPVPTNFMVFDAHSLWHLATAPATLWLYSWISDDLVGLAREERASHLKKAD